MPSLAGSRRKDRGAEDLAQLARVGRVMICCACGTMSERLEVSHCPAGWSGKGMGIKGHPALLARLCVTCHSAIDRHEGEWEVAWLRAYAKTQALLYDADKAAAGGGYIEFVD